MSLEQLYMAFDRSVQWNTKSDLLIASKALVTFRETGTRELKYQSILFAVRYTERYTKEENVAVESLRVNVDVTRISNHCLHPPSAKPE